MIQAYQPRQCEHGAIPIGMRLVLAEISASHGYIRLSGCSHFIRNWGFGKPGARA